ncbi:uncharacterized protein LOC131944537 [Physella acuta]|uniref:uncharacterized protein LOC131944537 n=1 Tax=Physella acuta TaxID=109671 RepID=UPI0027DE210A|nr:uncharacterized protein LOC131944537 [Physella acuta]
MRPLYQVQTISLLLKHLDSLRDVINPILISLNQTMVERQCWLKDDDRKTFKEMMLQLEDTNSSTLEQVSALLESSGQTEANISSTNPPITNTNVVASQQDNTEDKTCSKFGEGYFYYSVTIEEFQCLLHKLDITDMTTGSLERKYLQLEENINTVNDKLTRFEGKIKSQAKKSKQQDRRVEEIEKNLDVSTEKIEEQANATRKLSDNMRQMKTSTQEINKSCCDNKKHLEELSVITKDLVKKTNDNETSVQDISESLSRTDEKLTNGELKTGAMCQVLAKRFSQFESLQNVFSQLMKSREQSSVQLTEKLDALETKCQSNVGFSAMIKHDLSLTAGAAITEFSQVFCNTGGCFQPTTGEFTVPTDGLYCLSFNIDAVFKGEASIALYRKRLSTKTKTGYQDDNNTEDYISEQATALVVG